MTSTANPSGHPPVTLISGYRGLAETILEHFDRAGHRLSILVRKKAAIPDLSKKYPNALLVEGDVGDLNICSQWVEQTVRKFGAIDLLINNAAITGPCGRLHEVEFSAIQETIEIDLTAPLFLSQKVMPHFLKQGSGVIINLSGGGATNPRPFFSPYGFCKTALVRFTETLAEEYPELRFYSISPGFLKTPMVESVTRMDPAKVGKREFDEAKRRVEQGGDDPNRAAELMVWLFEKRPERLNGKLISAVWDKYRNPPDYPKEAGWWTLRRVDEVCLKHLSQEPRG